MTEKKLEIDHSRRGHAILSASSAYRWLHCTPSIRISEGILERESAFASEGTDAHEHAEKWIRMLLEGKSDEVIIKTLFNEGEEELRDNVKLYVDYVFSQYNRLKQIDNDALLMPEVVVSYDNVAKEGFGTSDCVIVGGNEIIIVDLKYGKGVRVDAINNPQLRLYGIGTLNKFMPLYEGIKTITMVIVQPRLDHLSEEEMTVEDLYAWGNNVVKPLAEQAYKGTGEFAEGKWCGFCKAKGCCPLQAKKNLSLLEDMEGHKDTTKLTNKEIAQILEKGKDLDKWFKSVQNYATDSALLGEEIPGYKLIEGQSRQIWDDEEEAAKGLKYAGLSDDEIFKKNIITPKQALSVLEDRVDEATLEAVKLLTKKANINPKLVPNSDYHEALSRQVIDELMGNSDN